MKTVASLLLAFAVAAVAHCQQENPLKVDIKSPPQTKTFFNTSSLIEFAGVSIDLSEWFTTTTPDFYPTKHAKRYKELYGTTQSPQELDDIKKDIERQLANKANWRFIVTSKPKEGSPKYPIVNGNYAEYTNDTYGAVVSGNMAGKKQEVEIQVRAYSVKDDEKNAKPEWVTLTDGGKSKFELDFSKKPNVVDSFEPSDASEVTLLDKTKATVRRLDIEIQRVVGGNILTFESKLSTNSKDTEANGKLSLVGRTLKNLDNFQTVFHGLQYETNQLGTNQLATLSFGTKWYLPLMVGVNGGGEAGFRSFAEFKAEGGYWLRQDPLTSDANAKKTGAWITGQYSIGPIYIGAGDTAIFANATGYYFPMKDRTFGKKVDMFEGYFEAGFLIPLGATNVKEGKGTWIKLSYINGAEQSNAFANKRSFAITISNSLKF